MSERIQQFYREIALITGGIVLVGIGVLWSRLAQPVPEMEIVSAADKGTSVLSASTSAQLAVDISGAVVKPGVYYFSSGQRVAEAIAAAGGLSTKADTVAIGRSVNQAEKLRDGQKIYLPSLNDQATSSKLQTNSNYQIPNSKVNINGASQAELEALPGIGPVTAQKIIAGRPYGEVQELVNKKIVGAKTFDQIKDQLQTW